MNSKRWIITALTALLPLAGLSDLEESDLDVKRIVRSVAYSLPLFHLNQLPMDEYISTNAFNLYIDMLDPNRSYYLQSDIERMQDQAPELHKLLRKGDISFATEAYELLKKRIDDRMQFVEDQLEKGFDTSVEEKFVWDRSGLSWPADQEEWNEIWRKRLKNEYVARLVSQQVYTNDTETASSAGDTNRVAETETTTEGTNETSRLSLDEEAETADMTPEEFILERYEQFRLTMESFDEEMLLQRYLTAFSQVYDPHSDYMSPSSVEDFDINMKLSLVGIGAMLRPDDGTAKIVRLIPGGPAETDGRLQPGDQIVAVGEGNEEPVSIMHWPLYKAVRLIRGEKDTKVVLTVIPASDRSGTRTKKIDLIRDEVKLEEQAAKSEVRTIKTADGTSRKLGVITLPDFYADFKATESGAKDARRASVDVQRLIHKLMLEDVEGIILDLRNNGGGSLVEAIETAGLFISSGPIVQVKEQRGIQVLPDADPEIDFEGPMIVLVNRLSASASEIVAAALQDYDRAVIVGDEKTHGKGTVQTLMPLGENRGSLKLTTAGFYRINGGSTQLKGVTPDIIIPSYLDVMDIGEETLEHALPWDREREAMYRKQDGLAERVPLLNEQSKQRLSTNEEFKVYLDRRARLKERFDSKTVSLRLEDRLAEAEAEKELDALQNEMFLTDEQTDEEEQNDLVLRETLHILSDLVDLETQSERSPTLSSRDGSPAR